MQLEFESHPTVLVAHFRGRLDTQTSQSAEEVLLAEAGSRNDHLVVCLAETEYVSSAGLRVLLKAAKMMQGRGTRFALSQANPQVMEVLEISGFITIMRHFDDGEGALEYVNGAES